VTENAYSTSNKTFLAKSANAIVPKFELELESEYQKHLERTELALRQWIAFRREWSKKPSKKGQREGKGKTAETWSK
jgi:hypothetical protein